MEENKNAEEIAEVKAVEEDSGMIEDVVIDQATVEEQEETVDEKKEYKGMIATKNGLFLRGVIGGFILYYGYTILADISTTPADERMLLYIFIAVFGVAGLWIVIDSIKRLIKKEYEDS